VYFEESLKLPNALALLGGVSPDSGRPVVCLGLREHIYTHALSAPAFFMSQQEYLFGVMFQRIMASPLHVRLHYGHPDTFDRIWMGTRGGVAKASAIVNVSEDIFAGFNLSQRGGESAHCEFMQAGKGRDVGLLQICIFEGKISAGTAIALCTRDAFRFAEGMDFFRLASYYHTAGGFYISNALITASFLLNLYYLAALALTQLDRAILGTRTIFLLGEVSFLQWWMQLGMTSLLPLAALYALEHGLLTATVRTLRMLGSLAPIFFMFEIQCKVRTWCSPRARGWMRARALLPAAILLLARV
jgi:callose synthase